VDWQIADSAALTVRKLERHWLEKFNQLTATLDKFLKRLTDSEEEFKVSRRTSSA
jgi:hypothetical protein